MWGWRLSSPFLKMAKTYFTADLHLGDRKVMELDRRPFSDLGEQDEEIIRRWNRLVCENDRVYILGDLSSYGEEKTVSIVKRLNGKKHFIRGNHDRLESEAFRECFESVGDYDEINVDGKHVVLCHYPIAHWRGQRYGYLHLYGHTHNGEDHELFELYRAMCRERGIRFYAYNVGCMFHDYSPVSIDELILKAKAEKELREREMARTESEEEENEGTEA